MTDAVIVLDMLDDFVSGVLGTERARNVVRPLADELLPAAREHGVRVVYANDSHLPEDTELDLWGEHAMRGTDGAEVIEELTPHAADDVFQKRFYDGFHETGLDEHLRSLGVDRVVITGLHTHMCCRHTAASAFFHGYDIVVPADCVDAFTREDHERGLEYLEGAYGAEVTTAEALVGEWEAATRAVAGADD